MHNPQEPKNKLKYGLSQIGQNLTIEFFIKNGIQQKINGWNHQDKKGMLKKGQKKHSLHEPKKRERNSLSHGRKLFHPWPL
jgi:hypothetical protein